jgi:uncharacterized protein
MLIDIRSIPDGHSVIEQNVTMTEEQIADGRLKGPVACHAQVDRLKSHIYLHITLKCKVQQECSRCLEPFDFSVGAECDVILRHRGFDQNEEKDDKGNEEYYPYGDSDIEVDIRQSIYEEIMVNLPIKPLCKEDCPGLIEYLLKVNGPGRDAAPEIDPRWEALKKFKKDQ